MTLKKWFILLLISTFSIIVSTSCSTVSGVGKDIQKVGQVIEQEANKNKKK